MNCKKFFRDLEIKIETSSCLSVMENLEHLNNSSEKRKSKAILGLFEMMIQERTRKFNGKRYTSSSELNDSYSNYFSSISQEEFHVLLLNSKNIVVKSILISKGLADYVPVHPREAFSEAIRYNASAIVLMHNHPSGDPEPSHWDFIVTKRLTDSSKIIGIKILDHLIFGRDSYYSFLDEGKM